MPERTVKIVGDTPVTKNMLAVAEAAAKTDINIKNLQKTLVGFNREGDRTTVKLKIMKDQFTTVTVSLKKLQ